MLRVLGARIHIALGSLGVLEMLGAHEALGNAWSTWINWIT